LTAEIHTYSTALICKDSTEKEEQGLLRHLIARIRTYSTALIGKDSTEKVEGCPTNRDFMVKEERLEQKIARMDNCLEAVLAASHRKIRNLVIN
jgi:hypothetical protein